MVDWFRSRCSEAGEIRQNYERRKRLLGAYHRVFADDNEDGQIVIDDLKRECGYDDTCFVVGGSDATAYNLGRRSVLITIRERLIEDIGRYEDYEKGR